MAETSDAFASQHGGGLTRLEYGAIEIAKGLMSVPYSESSNEGDMAKKAVRIARLVLKECNK
jgi:hypothetical protein|tara:strand:+ start:34 stop:219 length:186 start_codon:yes stop_codon:yes gene_type:complete